MTILLWCEPGMIEVHHLIERRKKSCPGVHSGYNVWVDVNGQVVPEVGQALKPVRTGIKP